jgi:hypothetical protein
MYVLRAHLKHFSAMTRCSAAVFMEFAPIPTIRGFTLGSYRLRGLAHTQATARLIDLIKLVEAVNAIGDKRPGALLH